MHTLCQTGSTLQLGKYVGNVGRCFEAVSGKELLPPWTVVLPCRARFSSTWAVCLKQDPPLFINQGFTNLAELNSSPDHFHPTVTMVNPSP